MLYHKKVPTPWQSAIQERRPANVAAVAVASKMARTAWAILAKGQAYRRDHVSVRPALRGRNRKLIYRLVAEVIQM